jgi:hypothetical protein
MHNEHEIHLHEREYIVRVNKYLVDHYGTSLEDLAIDTSEVANGLHAHLYPSEFVNNNAKRWGIKRLSGSIAGTAHRIVIA